jgi:hypothetical protein
MIIPYITDIEFLFSQQLPAFLPDTHAAMSPVSFRRVKKFNFFNRG